MFMFALKDLARKGLKPFALLWIYENQMEACIHIFYSTFYLTGTILCMCPTNESLRYIVTHNDAC